MLSDIWRLVKPYWTSKEKGSAWSLLLAVIALNLGMVYIGVRINQWNKAFYNALQSFDSTELFRQFGVFCLLVVCAISISVYAVYLNQMLYLRWRRWLTHKYLAVWLADRTYYQLQLSSSADNPDQRISEDIDRFAASLMSLSVGLISSLASLASFLIILWGLSGGAEIPIGNLGKIYVPGFLVWAALIYAGVGTWVTLKIGQPLVGLNFNRQRFEADFRFSLVRLRENAESVAIYRGERSELRVFHRLYENVFENFWQIMRRQRIMGLFTSGYAQMAPILPMVLIAPHYFSKIIGLGGLMQVVNAFCSVHNSLSFIINSYPEIAALQAVTQRLSSFEKLLPEIQKSVRYRNRIIVRSVPGGNGIAVKRLDLDLPGGNPLLRGVSFKVKSGEAILIKGEAGVGKSALLRAMAGLWPFGRGFIELGRGSVLFVPQNAYISLGTLADTLVYPGSNEDVSPECLRSVLAKVGLGALSEELEQDRNWSERLSASEQQRLAFARILLIKPATVFLDDATSALDRRAEAQLYELLRDASWRPTILSTSHRADLGSCHDQIIDLADFDPLPFEAGAYTSLTGIKVYSP
jgi:putative ATP-binding cassette transporter